MKANRLTTRLRRRFDIKPSPIAPDLLTLFEVIGYTVVLEADIISGKHKAQCSSNTEVASPSCLPSFLLGLFSVSLIKWF
ncbi:MAG: hypothetical protein KME30_17665 [Iphinoe sp. HA4291-MV1]|nr:hypothetical protein [Iphinoe sp. HA4291-MV1]